jgi:hypothetical protein
VKHAWEGDEPVPMVKEDDAMPMVKEDDMVPVLNQDEALVDLFSDRDDWAVATMKNAFLKIKGVLQNTDLVTLNPPREEKVSNYVFIFHQLTDVLEELLAYLNKSHADNVEYILTCYWSRIDGFDTSIAMQGISTTTNTEKHWRNLVLVDAKQVANRITADEDNDIDTNNDEEEDSDSDNKE